MIYSYTTGIDILQNHIDQIKRGQFRVLLFFLGTAYDESFLDGVKSLAKDLDALTGPHCLAMAFMPPPRDNPFKQSDYVDAFKGGGKDRNIDEWDDFVSEMTKNTYELARYLDIPEHHLPCLVFIDTDNTEFAILRLRDKTLREIYPKLREIFADWYSANKEVFDRYDSAAAARGYIAESSHVKRLMEEKLRQEVIPDLEQVFVEAIAGNTTLDLQKAKGYFRNLRQQPLNTQPLVDFLRSNNLTIEVGEDKIGWQDFNLHYRQLYRSKVQTEENWFSKPPELNSPVTKFPMDKIEQLSNSVELRKAGGDISNWVAGKKPIFDTLISILKLFGLGA
jgi:hypothetical protein